MKLPPFPSRLEKTSRYKTIDGRSREMKVTGEIRFQSSVNPKKLICLHRLLLDGKRTEFRLGYYVIGVKRKMRGKWTWGQYATMLPKSDLKKLFQKAKRKKWL